MMNSVPETKKECNLMSWTKMRIPGGGQSGSLPGDRGRYLLWLEPPYVDGEGHYVHFSWKGGSFCIRDYIRQVERRQDRAYTAADIWKAASNRIPAKGELYVPVENFEFWTAKMTELTESYKQGRTSRLWSRLSSKFAPKPKEAEQSVEAERRSNGSGNANERDVYQKFMAFWRNGAGFDVVEGTKGCSARYNGGPLLWVYLTRFQIAPQGKGNAHHREVREIRDRHFPELQVTKDTISFNSEHFTWDRFRACITDVQNMIRTTGN
jgi:hypothetical protein